MDRNIPKPARMRAVFISGIHLGSEDCSADLLLDFLHTVDTDCLFLIGDPGNHGETFREFDGAAVGNAETHRKYICRLFKLPHWSSAYLKRPARSAVQYGDWPRLQLREERSMNETGQLWNMPWHALQRRLAQSPLPRPPRAGRPQPGSCPCPHGHSGVAWVSRIRHRRCLD